MPRELESVFRSASLPIPLPQTHSLLDCRFCARLVMRALIKLFLVALFHCRADFCAGGNMDGAEGLTCVLGFAPMSCRFLILILSVLSLFASEAGEIVMLKAFSTDNSASQQITLAAGESARLAGVSFRGSSPAPARLHVIADSFNFSISLLDAAGSVDFTVPGPATLYYDKGTQSNRGFATVEITRAPELTPAIPASAAVIPEDADGQFDVLLESTTDGIEWTQALPGTYGGSTMKRFFRTRIVRKS